MTLFSLIFFYLGIVNFHESIFVIEIIVLKSISMVGRKIIPEHIHISLIPGTYEWYLA